MQYLPFPDLPAPPQLQPTRWCRLLVTVRDDGIPAIAYVELVDLHGRVVYHRAMTPMPGFVGDRDVLGALLRCADEVTRDA